MADLSVPRRSTLEDGEPVKPTPQLPDPSLSASLADQKEVVFPSSSVSQQNTEMLSVKTASSARDLARAEGGRVESSSASDEFAGLKLHASQLSLLRAKNPFRLPDSSAIPLNQQSYTQALSHIITRDYYPDLPLLKLIHQLLEAEQQNDVQRVVHLVRRIRALTPASVVNRQGTFGKCWGSSPSTYLAAPRPSGSGAAASDCPTAHSSPPRPPREGEKPSSDGCSSAREETASAEGDPCSVFKEGSRKRVASQSSYARDSDAVDGEREDAPSFFSAQGVERSLRRQRSESDSDVEADTCGRRKDRRKETDNIEASPGPCAAEAGTMRGSLFGESPAFSRTSQAPGGGRSGAGTGNDIIVPVGPDGKLHRVRTELRLDTFLSRYTSDDNKSFLNLVKLEKLEKEKSQKWIDITQEEHNARMVEIQRRTVAGERTDQLAVGFLSSRNNLFYKNFDTLEAHRQPYELNRRSGEISNANTRYSTAERQRQHTLYSLQVEKKQQLAATEEQRKMLEAVAAETAFTAERREQEKEKMLKASPVVGAVPVRVCSTAHAEPAEGPGDVTRKPELPTVTWGQILCPSLIDVASPSTPFLKSSIFEPCPVNSYAGVSGQLANSVNLATFKMPDPLPREKVLTKLQDQASARFRQKQLKHQELLGTVPGSPQCRLAAARAAAVVLRRTGRSGSSFGSAIGLGSGRRSSSASTVSKGIQKICRLAQTPEIRRNRTHGGSDSRHRTAGGSISGGSSVASSRSHRNDATQPRSICSTTHSSSSSPCPAQPRDRGEADLQGSQDGSAVLTDGLL
ncbi:nuclear protein Es2 [Toxoplasma gondii VAND]|uniref:Nuclear protein Es2 n=2 Tax=Toxoplasma gondii TaxID=5811 RepID=A0A086JA90_TOXGO|nr:nuclear protein Es2 [Toxoplasma gondii p89]KFH09162.1 nuclear protein Es2 [Toxoplasma gondii VAND]